MRNITLTNCENFLVERMTLDQASCFYHPNREAVIKCENCHRMICLEDKMTWRRYGGMDQADDIYTLCPVCYNERKEAARRVSKTFGPIFLLIFAIILIIGAAIVIFSLLMFFQMLGNFPSA